MLAWFAGELRDARVAIVGTYRSDLPLEHPLPALLAELDRSVLVERLGLAPLTPDEAARLLVDAAGGTLDPGRQRELLRRAGGVPLYLEELAVGPEAGVPASLQASVGARLARSGAHTRSIIELLAVAEGPVTVGLLAAAAGMPPAGIGPDLTAAIDTGLVRLHGSTASEQSVVEPRHMLLAETVQALLGREALAHLHRRWADTLAANPDLGPRSVSERTARTAGHLLAAGEVERAVPALIAAGDAALAVRAFGTADAFLGRALALADHRLRALVPDPVGLLEVAAMAALLAGSPRTAVARSARAAELAGAAPGSLAAATRLVRHAELLRGAGETEAAIDALEEALEVLPPDDLRWRALLELARAHLQARDPEAAIARCAEAMVGARGSGRTRTVAQAGVVLARALSTAGRHAESLTALDEARRSRGNLTGMTREPSRISRLPDAIAAAIDEAMVLQRSGDHEAAWRSVERGRRLAEARGLTSAYQTLLAAIGAWDLVGLGRWGEARTTLGAARPASAEVPGAAAWDAIVAWLDAAQGGPVREPASIVGDPLRREVLLGIPGPDWIAVRGAADAMAAWAEGGLQQARGIIRRAYVDPGIGDPVAAVELALLGLAIEADAVAVSRARSDATAAQACQDAAAELEVRARAALASLGWPPRDPSTVTAFADWLVLLVARLDGELARIAGRPAAEPWEAAVAASDRTPDAFVRSQARLRLAGALLDEDRDRARATMLLRDAFQLADGLGATPLAGAVERLARRARIVLAVGPGASGPRAAALTLGLSEREVDVLALLALGRTDRELAQELFITEKTAGHHVSHILAKLEVARRGEAAAVAHRIGLAGDGSSLRGAGAGG
jgi:DNA-binding CsgD family transcriptional regulator/tetratricopeptide (TPR) repeat protein